MTQQLQQPQTQQPRHGRQFENKEELVTVAGLGSFRKLKPEELVCFLDARDETYITENGELIRCMVRTYLIDGKIESIISPIGGCAGEEVAINKMLSRAGQPVSIISEALPESEKVLVSTLKSMKHVTEGLRDFNVEASRASAEATQQGQEAHQQQPVSAR